MKKHETQPLSCMPLLQTQLKPERSDFLIHNPGTMCNRNLLLYAPDAKHQADRAGRQHAKQPHPYVLRQGAVLKIPTSIDSATSTGGITSPGLIRMTATHHMTHHTLSLSLSHTHTHTHKHTHAHTQTLTHAHHTHTCVVHTEVTILRGASLPRSWPTQPLAPSLSPSQTERSQSAGCKPQHAPASACSASRAVSTASLLGRLEGDRSRQVSTSLRKSAGRFFTARKACRTASAASWRGRS
jgi:hypothetical protein